MGPAANLAFGARPGRDDHRDLPPAARPVLRDVGGRQRLPRARRQRVRALRPGARRGRRRGRRRRHPAVDRRRRTATRRRRRGRRDRGQPGRRAWLHVWDGRRQPPAAGRQRVRALRPPGRRRRRPRRRHRARRLQRRRTPRSTPARPRSIDNGVDEDCSGADTENLDRDADGSPASRRLQRRQRRRSARAPPTSPTTASTRTAPAPTPSTSTATATARCARSTATTRNAAIRPGARDIPRNRVDEDCSGADAAVPDPGVRRPHTWDVDGARFKLLTLADHAAVPEGHEGGDPLQGLGVPLQSSRDAGRAPSAVPPRTLPARSPVGNVSHPVRPRRPLRRPERIIATVRNAECKRLRPNGPQSLNTPPCRDLMTGCRTSRGSPPTRPGGAPP